jgi:Cu2+-exporting ATPase
VLVKAYRDGEKDLLPWIAALESESNHPIAIALTAEFGPVAAEDRLLIRDRVERHGFGLSAEIPLGSVLIGSLRYAREMGVEIDEELMKAIQLGCEQGMTAVVVALNGHAKGVAWLRDELHDDSRDQLDWLRDAGWQAEILSGDSAGPVRHVAHLMGVAANDAHSEMSPEEKLARVQEATAERVSTVMMVGDGVNDAAALAAADIGVAVQGGAEASLAAADVYLTEPGVGKLTELVNLSRHTMHVARRNLAISLAYNSVAVLLAAIGWITPLAAAVIMPASSATVLASAVGFSLSKRR